jgi:hypothetical protein
MSAGVAVAAVLQIVYPCGCLTDSEFVNLFIYDIDPALFQQADQVVALLLRDGQILSVCGVYGGDFAASMVNVWPFERIAPGGLASPR